MQERETAIREAEERLGLKPSLPAITAIVDIKSELTAISNEAVLDSNNSSKDATAVVSHELVEYAVNDGWVEYWDDEAKSYYYYNTLTREASWEPPSSTESSAGGSGEY